VRQRRNTHSGSNHLQQQQRVINALQRWADARRLQEMSPDIQTRTLNRVDKQGFAGKIFRGNTRFGGEWMIGR